MKRSLLATARPGTAAMAAFLDSVAAQACRPDEVVILDMGMDDQARAIVRAHPVGARLAVLPAGPEQGAVAALLAGDLVAVTDASCRLPPEWLERVTDLQGANVVAGTCEPVVETLAEACLVSVERARVCCGPEVCARSVGMRREAWTELADKPGFFDLDGLALLEAIAASRLGMRQEPGAVVRFRLGKDTRAVFLRGYRATQADGRSLRRTKSHLLRLGIYAAGLEMLLMSLWRPLWCLPVLAALGLALLRPVKVYRAQLDFPLNAEAVARMAWMLVVSDLGRILGHLSGLKNAHELPHETGGR